MAEPENDTATDLPILPDRWPPPDQAHPAQRFSLPVPTDGVYDLAVAPDGTWVAAAGDDGAVRVWDVATGQLRHILKGHAGAVLSVTVGSDGRRLVSGGRDGTVRRWDAENGLLDDVLDYGDPVTGLAGVPGGDGLIVVSGDKIFVLEDVCEGWSRTLTFRAWAVAVGPSWLAAGGPDGLGVWDLTTGELRDMLSDKKIHDLAVAPDGAWIAAGGEDWFVRVWDAATGELLHELDEHLDAVHSLDVAPDGSWLVSGGEDRTLRIWDTATGRVRKILSGHHNTINAVIVSPDGQWIASAGSDRTLRIWDTESADPPTNGRSESVESLVVASGGAHIITSTSDTTLQVWDAETAHLISDLKLSVRSHGLTLSPDGTRLAVVGWDFAIRLLDRPHGQARGVAGRSRDRAQATDARGLDGGTRGRPFDGDAGSTGTGAAAGLDAGAQSSASMILEGHTNHVWEVAFGPDGTWLASVSRDRTVRLWDARTGDLLRILKGHRGPVRAVVVAPDGSWLATAGEDRTVRLWNVRTGKQIRRMKGHSDAILTLGIGPGGSWLASGGRDGTIRIWDPLTGHERPPIGGHRGAVNHLAVSPDGRNLASVGDDGTLRVWDVLTGAPLAQAQAAIALALPQCGFNCCGWLPGGLVAGGAVGLHGYDWGARRT